MAPGRDAAANSGSSVNAESPHTLLAGVESFFFVAHSPTLKGSITPSGFHYVPLLSEVYPQHHTQQDAPARRSEDTLRKRPPHREFARPPSQRRESTARPTSRGLCPTAGKQTQHDERSRGAGGDGGRGRGAAAHPGEGPSGEGGPPESDRRREERVRPRCCSSFWCACAQGGSRDAARNAGGSPPAHSPLRGSRLRELPVERRCILRPRPTPGHTSK